MVEDVLEGVLAEDEEVVIVTAKAIGTHLQLVGALLAADVEDALLGHVEHRLQRERRFSDARFAA